MKLGNVGRWIGRLGVVGLTAGSVWVGGRPDSPRAGLAVAPAMAEAAPALSEKTETEGVCSSGWGEKWSQRAWGKEGAPAAGADVTIPRGEKVRIDVPVKVGRMFVDGDVDLGEGGALEAEEIIVTGRLSIGHLKCPRERETVVRITGPRSGAAIPAQPGMGGMVMEGEARAAIIATGGGVIEMVGRAKEPWGKLLHSVRAGEQIIDVDRVGGWQVGDELLLVGTAFRDDAERGVIEEIVPEIGGGGRLRLRSPVKKEHWGAIVGRMGGAGGVDERGEVADLTRSIRIEGSAGFGPEVMAMGQGYLQVDGIRVEGGGLGGQLSHYPLHWHLVGSSGKGEVQIVRNSVSVRSRNRCIVIHGTQGVRVEGNVCVETPGHAIFLEEGSEEGNIIRGNLVSGVEVPVHPLLPSDSRPAGFWISNPANRVEDNVATGAAIGFWYALAERVSGVSGLTSSGMQIRPRTLGMGSFDDNVAHGNREIGLNMDEGPRDDGTTESTEWRPMAQPDGGVGARIRGFTGYMNRSRGAWIRASPVEVDSISLDENLVGLTVASKMALVHGGTILGEGRGLVVPDRLEGGARVRGFEFYDGPEDLSHMYFGAFEGRTGSYAIGFKRNNIYTVSPMNTVEGLSWLDGSKRLVLGAGLGSEDGDRSAVIVDKDGSILGQVGQLVSDNGILADGSCLKAGEGGQTDGALLCRGQYATLRVEGTGGQGARVVRDDGAEITLHWDAEQERISTNIPLGHSYSIQGTGGGVVTVGRLLAGEHVGVTMNGSSYDFRPIRKVGESFGDVHTF